MLPSRRDLAREYRVSSVTIERALSPLITEGVLRADDRRGTFVARIADAPGTLAEALDLPGMAAIRSIDVHRPRSSTTATIGIVASLYVDSRDHLQLNNFWVRLLIHSLEQSFSEGGHRTRFYNRVQPGGSLRISIREAVSSAVEDGVDALAIVAFGAAPRDIDHELAEVPSGEIPVVCITSGELCRPVAHVFFDNRSAGFDAAQCLLQNGCRQILYFSPFCASWSAERLDGVRAAVEMGGGAALEAFVDLVPWVQEEDPSRLGYAWAQRYFQDGSLPDGVICANDGAAFGLIDAARERGLEAGCDYAIVSFDDHPEARDKGLTSLRPPMQAMGAEASLLVLRALKGDRTNVQTRLRWHLIPRSSSRSEAAATSADPIPPK